MLPSKPRPSFPPILSQPGCSGSPGLRVYIPPVFPSSPGPASCYPTCHCDGHTLLTEAGRRWQWGMGGRGDISSRRKNVSQLPCPLPANLTAVMEDECSSNVCCRLYSRPASNTWISRSRLADARSFRPGIGRTPSAHECPEQAPIWVQQKGTEPHIPKPREPQRRDRAVLL